MTEIKKQKMKGFLEDRLTMVCLLVFLTTVKFS